MDIGTLGGGMKVGWRKGTHLLQTNTGHQSEAAFAGVKIAGTEMFKALKMGSMKVIEIDQCEEGGKHGRGSDVGEEQSEKSKMSFTNYYRTYA